MKALILIAAISVADSMSPDVLVVEHAYDGTVERAGKLTNWQYDGRHMLVEFSPDGDGIYRNGFEAPVSEAGGTTLRGSLR